MKLHKYTIPKELLRSCKQVYSKYEETHQKTRLNPLKKAREKEKWVDWIKRQKLSLERSVKSVQADGDNYLPLAEEKSNISYLVKYNAFSKTVWEKEDCSGYRPDNWKTVVPVKNLEWVSAQVVKFLIFAGLSSKIDNWLFSLPFLFVKNENDHQTS